MRRIYFIACVQLLACAPALYVPTEEHAMNSQTSLDDLKLGRQLYADHCGSCHQLYLPRDFNENVWKLQLDSMKRRAKITSEQQQLIYQFIKAGR